MTLAITDVDPYLEPKDLSRLQRAHQLRKQFIKSTLPPWAAVITLGAIALVLATGPMQLAGWRLLAPHLPPISESSIPSDQTVLPDWTRQGQVSRHPAEPTLSSPAESNKNWIDIMERIEQKWSDVKMKHENRGLKNGQGKDI